ncbi:uncharacterized protein LOC116687469 isoform X2 [Etheostoma spectabile]|uniref:uncharacterized protein LOC116687469 isoform X2 n=1 Tax=Etheostoma spectabile TaxID=54343 RepID=UPI0013AF2C85|nr:uncharacterized protein LOC116687469 isoform X2 [Etheostoma spectabile]
MGLFAALVALLCIYAPAWGDDGCSPFRHLENGQTFFRYGGLLVIFRCRPGYKLHGYKTNSCVSGKWSRDTPVCVGSGCSNPGRLIHGTSSMNEDGSWAVFSCDSGFRLHGPSMLYCKGLVWNSTKPVCKESDMMSSISGVSVQKPNIQQNLQAAVILKTQQQSYYDTHANTASKEVNLKLGSLSHSPSQMSNREMIKVTVHLQQHVQFPNFKVKDGVQLTHHEETGTGRHDLETEKVDKVVSKSHLSTTVSSTLSMGSGTDFVPTSPLHHMKSALPVPGSEKVFKFRELVTFRDDATSSVVVTGSSLIADEDQQAETGFQYPLLSQPGSVDEEEPTETSTTLSSVNLIFASSTSPSSPASSLSAPVPSYSASTSLSSSSSQSNRKTQVPYVPSDTYTTSEPRSHQTENHNDTFKPLLLSLNLSRRPMCPYPPVPAHGTFYFRNVENPGPREYRHYIQYACYPGYTLAHGDIHSYCQHGGAWSGITPVCLELTPCSVNNGGCSQLCSHSQHYNQSSNQTQTRTQCHCRAGFTLLDDWRTCRDVDECLLPAAVTGCVFGCVNTPGSFYCQCPVGYSLQTADSHCQDIDECAVNQGLGPCTEQCHNSPGSYQCACSYGHILAGNGHSCIAECPPGYRKEPKTTTSPENTTAQTFKEECVDINECQKETCEWQCVNLPGSHRCICPRGYTLHRDGRRCKDINECSRKNGGCSHLCVNQKGGYKCACPASHRLSPYSWKKCVPRTKTNTAG